jgi:hypothetical protein
MVEVIVSALEGRNSIRTSSIEILVPRFLLAQVTVYRGIHMSEVAVSHIGAGERPNPPFWATDLPGT